MAGQTSTVYRYVDDALTRRVERLMDAEAQVETALADEERARLDGLVAPSRLAGLLTYYGAGDQLAVYVRRGSQPHLLLVGPTRRYEAPPANYLASRPWRRSQWRLAGLFDLAPLVPRCQLCDRDDATTATYSVTRHPAAGGGTRPVRCCAACVAQLRADPALAEVAPYPVAAAVAAPALAEVA